MVLQRFASVFSRYSDQKTVKYFCNRLFDKMFKSKNVTEDSIVKFGRAIDFHVKDVKLNKLLKKCFGQYNAYEIKSIIENTPDEEKVTVSVERLARQLLDDMGNWSTREAESVDEQIYFYLDEETFNMPDEDIVEYLKKQ